MAGWAHAQVMYDHVHDYRELTEFQIEFLGLVALRRQRLDVLKTVALVKSSLAGYNPGNSKEIVESAQKALKDYVYAAENLMREDHDQQRNLARALTRETNRVYRVTPV